METHSSTIVAMATTTATTVAKINNSNSNDTNSRDNSDGVFCFKWKPVKILVTTVAIKILPRLQCRLQTSGGETYHSSHIFQNASFGEVNVVFFIEEVLRQSL